MAKPKFSYYDYVCLISFIVWFIAQLGTCDGVVPLLGGKKLIIGVPKKPGFTQFVDVQVNPSDKQLVKVTGFSIEVFNATTTHLQNIGFNVSVEFRAFVNDIGGSAGTYDTLLQNIPGQYDAVVGDVTIVANRSNYVDLTLPYAESGVKMLVKVRQEQNWNKHMWNFVRPFSWDLWLSIVMFSIFIGCTLRFMERHVHNENAGPGNPPPPREQLNKAVSFLWLPLTQAVLPERESLVKNCSRFVLVLWLILAGILMQSYTASLSSILTVDQLQPDYIGLNDVMRDPQINVGYQRDSFVRDLLVDRLKLDESRLKSFRTIEEYKDALDKGSRNGGVDAIFDEAPYIKVFLKECGPSYAMSGLSYHTGGFGFAFPKNSSITSYFSRAILNVTESDAMEQIERKYFGSRDDDEVVEQNKGSSSENTSTSLTTYSFGGLFIVIGGLTFLALVVSESGIWRKPMMLAKTYSKTLVVRYSKKASQLRKGSTITRDFNSSMNKDNKSNNQQTIEVYDVEDVH
ncbi:glutamate receptor 2.9-like [Neltuma alba]|uniref:glutamate receptor 2.9-like n=1 Tax=Neltuma alba TaxID=207710 RepID=UPI0010A3DCA9|nr:glutamate receptor 2.9-like [Prosopis alba]XP_028786842.1 glutamate receptor 2.9-like [Prosopis alba]